MEIYTHPFVILAFGFLLEVAEEILLLLCLVEKTKLFIYQTLIADATYGLGLFFHFLIETALHFVDGVRKDDNTESLTACHLVGVRIAYRRVIVKIQR
ncbi:hypothetical protein IMSAG025_01466 [Muribaculaceae bacterium]|nr:hypothetical protein IMSAG025_01466 [Muribaculaceae bacterium]